MHSIRTGWLAKISNRILGEITHKNIFFEILSFGSWLMKIRYKALQKSHQTQKWHFIDPNFRKFALVDLDSLIKSHSLKIIFFVSNFVTSIFRKRQNGQNVSLVFCVIFVISATKKSTFKCQIPDS